jgi:hypothetical protein
MRLRAMTERPVGVYLVNLYFVLAGFLEAIGKYHEADHPWSFVPLAENSIWTLAVDPVICLSIAYLIWRFAAFGRLAALVYGYLMLATYLVIGFSYFVVQTPLNVTPLFVALSVFHVLTLPALLWYLQPARQRKVFHVSLWEILLSSD